jgi:hypothetical protein
MSTRRAWPETRDGETMRIVRVGKLFNRKNKNKGIDEKGIFDIGRARGYRDYLLTDPTDPFIPGTDVPRLRLIHLGGKSVGVSDDEINRVVAGLQDWYQTKRAERAAFAGKKKNPPDRDGWWVR